MSTNIIFNIPFYYFIRLPIPKWFLGGTIGSDSSFHGHDVLLRYSWRLFFCYHRLPKHTSRCWVWRLPRWFHQYQTAWHAIFYQTKWGMLLVSRIKRIFVGFHMINWEYMFERKLSHHCRLCCKVRIWFVSRRPGRMVCHWVDPFLAYCAGVFRCGRRRRIFYILLRAESYLQCSSEGGQIVHGLPAEHFTYLLPVLVESGIFKWVLQRDWLHP